MRSSFFVLFMFGVVLGSLLAITASSWFIVWVGLELNLISFLPLIFMGGVKGVEESGVKYFFVQSIGSMILLVGSLFPLFVGVLGFYYFLVFALSLSIGAAPLHFWFPSIMEGMDWISIVLLLTWQKLALLVLIAGFDCLMMVGIISALVGAFGGFNQTSLKKILAYSSIFHIGWMLGGVGNNLFLGLKYYFIYFMFSLVLVFIFYWWGVKSLGQLMLGDMYMKFSVFLLMISMGGLPPLLGFFPKWVIIWSLLSEAMFFSVILIFSSLVSLYFYFRLMYGHIFSKSYDFWFIGGSISGELMLMVLVMIMSLGGGVFFPLFML